MAFEKIVQVDIDRIMELHEEGLSVREITQVFIREGRPISSSTVRRYIKKFGSADFSKRLMPEQMPPIEDVFDLALQAAYARARVSVMDFTDAMAGAFAKDWTSGVHLPHVPAAALECVDEFKVQVKRNGEIEFHFKLESSEKRAKGLRDTLEWFERNAPSGSSSGPAGMPTPPSGMADG